MKRILIVILLFVSTRTTAQNADSLNHIYTDNRCGQQYKNIYGVQIACISQGGEIITADRLYIYNIQVNTIEWTASFSWCIRYPVMIDSETIDYHDLLGANATIPIDDGSNFRNSKPALYGYVSDHLPLLFDRIQLTIRYTEE